MNIIVAVVAFIFLAGISTMLFLSEKIRKEVQADARRTLCRVDSLREETRENYLELKGKEEEVRALGKELKQSQEAFGLFRFQLKSNVERLDGHGYKSKNGPLERSKAFRGLKDLLK